MREKLLQQIKDLERENFIIELDDYAYLNGRWSKHQENEQQINKLQAMLASCQVKGNP